MMLAANTAWVLSSLSKYLSVIFLRDSFQLRRVLPHPRTQNYFGVSRTFRNVLFNFKSESNLALFASIVESFEYSQNASHFIRPPTCLVCRIITK